MNILAIDTSTRTLSLALAVDGKCVAYRNLALNRRMADAIIPQLTRFLGRKKLTLTDIDAIVAGRGPGSFTSLRVGVATIKGLCFGTDIPVAGVPSLDAIAAAAGAIVRPLCVINDARRGLLYSALYVPDGDRPRLTGEYRLLSWKDLRRDLKKPVLFAGDAVSLHHEEIVKAFGAGAALTAPKFQTPQARFLLPAGEKMIADGTAGDAAALEPLYLYPEDCQVRP